LQEVERGSLTEGGGGFPFAPSKKKKKLLRRLKKKKKKQKTGDGIVPATGGKKKKPAPMEAKALFSQREKKKDRTSLCRGEKRGSIVRTFWEKGRPPRPTKKREKKAAEGEGILAWVFSERNGGKGRPKIHIFRKEKAKGDGKKGKASNFRKKKGKAP